MWVRLQLDFGWWDFAYGISHLLKPHNLPPLQKSIEERWSRDGKAIAVLSVRSGLDLLLGTMKWPAGSEIVYSALNIPDMTMVARQHDLVPVPADLDVDRLSPELERIEDAITPKTKAILVAHLYGNFVPLEPILEIARKHGLMVIEDCAENFDGIYTGHPDADVSLFSFGPLKTATTLAGGVLRTRDAELCARLKAGHEQWPSQGRLDYFNRLCKYGTMRFFSAKWIYAEVRRMARLIVGDVDKMIHHTAKSFREDELLRRLRQRPGGPLLAAMARRFANFDHERIRQRTRNGKYLADVLRGHVPCPGADITPHNYWLFPVLMTDPARALAALQAAGFDATRVQSMVAVEAPPDRSNLEPMQIKQALKHMLLLPCYPGIPQEELKRMADVLIQVEKETSLVSALKITRQPADTVYNNGSLAATPQTCADSALVETSDR